MGQTGEFAASSLIVRQAAGGVRCKNGKSWLDQDDPTVQ